MKYYIWNFTLDDPTKSITWSFAMRSFEVIPGYRCLMDSLCHADISETCVTFVLRGTAISTIMNRLNVDPLCPYMIYCRLFKAVISFSFLPFVWQYTTCHQNYSNVICNIQSVFRNTRVIWNAWKVIGNIHVRNAIWNTQSVKIWKKHSVPENGWNKTSLWNVTKKQLSVILATQLTRVWQISLAKNMASFLIVWQVSEFNFSHFMEND